MSRRPPLIMMMHASDSGYQRYADEWSGGHGELRPFEQNAFATVSQTHRPIMDTIISAVCHGMLSRFPGVRIGSICLEDHVQGRHPRYRR